MPYFTILDGFKWPSRFPEKFFHQIRKMEFRSGDVVLSTFPRSGTFWTLYCIWDIINEGKPLPQPLELLQQVGGLDKFDGVIEDKNLLPSLRLMFTHVPLPFLPFEPKTKYIVVIRNPFDCCASLYQFALELFDGSINLPFDKFFHAFLNGEIPYGDYFDHLLAWYNHRKTENVKFLVYEEMLKDREKAIFDLASFLGEEYLKKMEGETLENVLHHTSFDYMKANQNFSGIAKNIGNSGTLEYIKKGIVGNWKNLFSEEQVYLLKAKMENKLKGTELLDYWFKTLEI